MPKKNPISWLFFFASLPLCFFAKSIFRSNIPSDLSIVWITLFLLVSVSPVARAADDYVWWEGESAVQTNLMDARSDFSPAKFPGARDALSGGDWLSCSHAIGHEEGYAKYQILIPESREYSLWTRKFWKHGPFKWRFGEGEWQTCGPNPVLMDDVVLGKNLNVNWVPLGKVRLEKGPIFFELRMLDPLEQPITCGFDCFVLTSGFFRPTGKLKPDEKSGKADEGYFPFEPSVDPFGANAIIDLRSLNEKTAGEGGFLRRDRDRIVLGNGTPVRFWGVDVRAQNIHTEYSSHDYLARKLAKLGVNFVRVHGGFWDINDPAGAIDPRTLDELHHFVAAMKREGIYTELSFYFPAFFKIKDDNNAIPGYAFVDDKRPWGLIFFEPSVQKSFRAGYKNILTAINPYTKLTLAQDPSVGAVEMVNEDSLLWGTIARKKIPTPMWTKLEDRFGAWVMKKYGSFDKAYAAWGGSDQTNDDPKIPRAVLFDNSALTSRELSKASAAKVKRTADQAAFFVDLQKSFYESTAKYLRDELHVGGMIVAGNWKTVDQNNLLALEHLTYTAGADVIDDHGYFTPRHEGEATYSIRPNQTYSDRVGVLEPEAIPLRAVQVDGFPQLLSEINWANPNRFRAEATLATSGYASLQGVDGVVWFAAYANYLADTAMFKQAVGSPIIAGTFPATALLYRRSDVREAPTAITCVVDPDEALKLKGAASLADVDPLASYVMPVKHILKPGAGVSAVETAALVKSIDTKDKTVRAATDEMSWNYGAGLIRMNAPRAQGAAGFLSKAGAIQLGEVTIESSNEYGSILVIALDDQPIATSKRILIQAVTEERPYGWKMDGDRIASIGGWPFGLKKIAATVTLKHAGEAKVVQLDENGYPTEKKVEKGEGNRIRLGEDGVYTVLSW